MCLHFSRKQPEYLPHVVDNIIFGVSVPDYPSRTVETTFLAQFWNLFTFNPKQQQTFIMLLKISYSVASISLCGCCRDVGNVSGVAICENLWIRPVIVFRVGMLMVVTHWQGWGNYELTIINWFVKLHTKQRQKMWLLCIKFDVEINFREPC